MRYLLSRDSRSVLTQLAGESTLCAFDFDGTLSPIVTHPDRAKMRVRTRKLLSRLAVHYPCVVVSGRARADLLNKLDGVAVARAIGNHGAETEASALQSRRLVRQWKAALKQPLAAIPGLWIEDKGLSLAIHYRQSPHKAETRRLVFEAVRNLPHLRAFGGKQVVNLVMDHAPDKGDAVAAERARLACKWLLYVGDDANDEAAFALTGNVVPVRVGRNQQSHARYYLRSQAEIDDLLDLLVRLREAVRGVQAKSRRRNNFTLLP